MKEALQQVCQDFIEKYFSSSDLTFTIEETGSKQDCNYEVYIYFEKYNLGVTVSDYGFNFNMPTTEIDWIWFELLTDISEVYEL